MWKDFLPHPEIDLLFVWIPLEEDAKIQLGREGQGSPLTRNWTHAIHEDHDQKIQEWIPRGNTGEKANSLN